MASMNVLRERCAGKCELCSAETDLAIFNVSPPAGKYDAEIMICSQCHKQIESATGGDSNHWRCLKDSMWSAVPAVQVMACRLLKRLESESWAQDLLDMLYLDEELQAWANAASEAVVGDILPTRDCHGAILQAGDTVTLIKDLDVKGASFTAKRGTAVRNIALTNNPEQIEGKVNGVRIVLLTCFVKKST